MWNSCEGPPPDMKQPGQNNKLWTHYLTRICDSELIVVLFLLSPQWRSLDFTEVPVLAFTTEFQHKVGIFLLLLIFCCSSSPSLTSTRWKCDSNTADATDKQANKCVFLPFWCWCYWAAAPDRCGWKHKLSSHVGSHCCWVRCYPTQFPLKGRKNLPAVSSFTTGKKECETSNSFLSFL